MPLNQAEVRINLQELIEEMNSPYSISRILDALEEIASKRSESYYDCNRKSANRWLLLELALGTAGRSIKEIEYRI